MSYMVSFCCLPLLQINLDSRVHILFSFLVFVNMTRDFRVTTNYDPYRFFRVNVKFGRGHSLAEVGKRLMVVPTISLHAIDM